MLLAMTQHKISLGPFDFLPTAVKVQGKPALEQWAGPLQFALWCQRASPWWIGDLLNAGDAGFGEAFSQVCEGCVSADQLQRYESVARRVPPENRRPNLSWSAHAVVARLPHDQQRSMLRLAEENGWSSEELRRQVQRL
jgi:hypothetical protein